MDGVVSSTSHPPNKYDWLSRWLGANNFTTLYKQRSLQLNNSLQKWSWDICWTNGILACFKTKCFNFLASVVLYSVCLFEMCQVWLCTTLCIYFMSTLLLCGYVYGIFVVRLDMELTLLDQTTVFVLWKQSGYFTKITNKGFYENLKNIITNQNKQKTRVKVRFDHC